MMKNGELLPLIMGYRTNGKYGFKKRLFSMKVAQKCACGCGLWIQLRGNDGVQIFRKFRHGVSGAENANWKGGRWKAVNGYYMIDRNTYEHRAIMEKKLGRKLQPNEIVHHRNGDIEDNREENLELLSSQSEHMKIHKLGRKKRLGRNSVRIVTKSHSTIRRICRPR